MPIIKALQYSAQGVFNGIEGIQAGSKWYPVILESVNECEILLFVWCHHTAKLPEISAAYRVAKEKKEVLIIPVRIDSYPMITELSKLKSVDIAELVYWHQNPPLERVSFDSTQVDFRASQDVEVHVRDGGEFSASHEPCWRDKELEFQQRRIISATVKILKELDAQLGYS